MSIIENNIQMRFIKILKTRTEQINISKITVDEILNKKIRLEVSYDRNTVVLKK